MWFFTPSGKALDTPGEGKQRGEGYSDHFG